jgi:uncharacterized protein (UPF0303 family)
VASDRPSSFRIAEIAILRLRLGLYDAWADGGVKKGKMMEQHERADLMERIAAQERVLVFEAFDEQVAWNLGEQLRALAVSRSLPIVIDIGLFHRPLFFCALPGSNPGNSDWARRKRNVVARFYKSSYAVGLESQAKGRRLTELGLSAADYADHGGAFPIAVRNCGVVGAAVVSGLAQHEDHALVVEAICGALEI